MAIAQREACAFAALFPQFVVFWIILATNCFLCTIVNCTCKANQINASLDTPCTEKSSRNKYYRAKTHH